MWWPAHDKMVYADRLPVWDGTQFVDPETWEPVTAWADALEDVAEPAHVSTFGRQVYSKGNLGRSEEAGRHIGYLTKCLTKSLGEVVGEHRVAAAAP